jgi:hypothetical protein
MTIEEIFGLQCCSKLKNWLSNSFLIVFAIIFGGLAGQVNAVTEKSDTATSELFSNNHPDTICWTIRSFGW